MPALTPSSRAPSDDDPLRWERWWSFNHDPYLSLGTLLERRNPSSREGVAERVALAAEYRRVARPALERFLTDGGPAPVLREVLLTLARLEDAHDPDPIDFSAYARHFLLVDPLEVKGAAILMLGIAGEEQETALLLSLFRDDERGRAAFGGPVLEAHRAQAAYALGLIASGSTHRGVRRSTVANLLDGLSFPGLDLQTASALALGRVPLDACDQELSSESHLCRGAELSALADVVLDEERHDWVRAHAAASLGRLGASFPDEGVRNDVAEILFWALHPRTRVDEIVRHGAVQGLGAFADGDDDEVDAAARHRLELVIQHGDAFARRLAMIALGQVAARGDVDEKAYSAAQSVLISELTRGQKGRKPWAALALSTLAFERLGAGHAVNEDVTMALRESLRRAKNPDHAGAFALSLAILRAEDPASREAVRVRHARARTPELRELTALVLGYLGDHDSAAVLREELAVHPTRALPLRLLGDAEVTGELAALLAADAEPAEGRFELVDVLAQTASPAALAPLVSLLTDAEADPYLRARAARAIGTLVDGGELHWTAPYANGIDYDLLTWSLRSPWANGFGLLDAR